MKSSLIGLIAGALVAGLLPPSAAHAQDSSTGTPASATPAAQSTPVFRVEEIDQLVAPIALYPDQLLAQILMASSYPIEIVQAERWVRDPNNAKLKGDSLAAALEPQTWDPSVKSLVPFPQVLQMMSDKLDWTQRLGDAFLAQQADVMDAVQRLRQQAQAAGTLKSTEQQTVTTEGPAIVIQPANPQVVYVPVYNPTVVYGTWPYPAYPPPYYPPPPAYYPYGSAFVSGLAFATGVAIVGSMWGWGNCNWGRSNVNVNYNTYNTINRTNINAGRATTLPANAGGNWQHQPAHRGAVPYRGAATQQAYQRPSTMPASAGQNFRGYDNAARPSQGAGQGAARPSQGAARPSQGAARPSQGAGQGAARPSQGAARPTQGAPSAGQGRPGTSAANRPAAQPAAPRQQPAAFNGMGSGRDVSAQSARGQASRQASPSRAASAGRAGGGGGGGGRRR